MKPSTGEIIATANKIVLLKFHRRYKNVVLHVHSRDPLSSCSVEGGSGDETTVSHECEH